MTNRQVVQKLRELGHTVEVYERKDGSIRVTSIDGTAYSSRLSVGVEEARRLLFTESLDQATQEKEEARRRIQSEQRKAARSLKKSPSALSAQSIDVQKEFKKFQAQVRRRNKQLKKAGKKPLPIPSWKATVSAAQKGGISPYRQWLRFKDWLSPLMGEVAPQELVNSLLEDIEKFRYREPDVAFIKPTIEAHRNELDVYAVKTAISWVYGMGKGIAQSLTKEEINDNLLGSLHKSK